MTMTGSCPIAAQPCLLELLKWNSIKGIREEHLGVLPRKEGRDVPTWDAAANGMVTEALKYGAKSSSLQWLWIQSTIPGFYSFERFQKGSETTYLCCIQRASVGLCSH